MDLGFSPAFHPIGDRRAVPSSHRVKARSLTLGATRSRLIQILRASGLYRGRIEARLRTEREMDLLLERRRLEQKREEREVARRLERRRIARLAEEQEAARHLGELRAARLHEQERFARMIEGRRAARLEKERFAYGAMSEEQRAAWRQEEEIVSWLTIEGSGP
jgi:hypothetical protein